MSFKLITEEEVLSVYPELNTPNLDKTVRHTMSNGITVHLRKGKFHNADGPAVIYPEGFAYYHNGALHRDDDLAALKINNRLHWYYRNKLHRIGLPAVLDSELQIQVWYQNNRKHRSNGPAVIHAPHGYVAWWEDGERHRLDGPARINLLDRTVEWWMNGELLNEEDLLILNKMATDYRQWPKYLSHKKLNKAAEFFRLQQQLDSKDQFELASSIIKEFK